MSEAKAPLRRHHRTGYQLREFLRRLAEKCDDDDVLFMAGAIAFNLVMALFPLLILGIGITGYVLSRFGDPTQAVVDLVTQNLPQAAGADLTGLVQTLTEGLLQRRTGYTIAGSVFLLWIATRLSASLRVSVRETFDIGSKRNPVHGKLFDTGAVMIGFLLLTLNLGVTVLGATAMDFGVSLFGLGGVTLSFAQRMLGLAVAFASIWTLLVLAYRFLPARPIRWRTAAIAATFHGGRPRELEVRLLMVRDGGGELRLHAWQSGDRRRPLLLDLLRVPSVYSWRRGGPGIHDARSEPRRDRELRHRDMSEARRVVARNRKARHEFQVLETFEAGIELKGPR